ncbi:hypothetical protein IT575_14755 [bacterium]|nr:hypothetical protein [bacterium]
MPSSAMTKSKPASDPPASASPEAAGNARLSLFAQIEKLAALQFGNRYLWLALILGLYMLGQLSWWQYKYMRFNTLELLGHLTGVLHVTLIALALILVLATPATALAWARRYPGQNFSFVACGLSAPLVLTPFYLALVLPLLILHRYPDLSHAAGISVPLMLLQRGLLLVCMAVVLNNLVLALRHNLRWAWGLCGGIALAAYLWLCYYLTWLSYTTEFWRRINDLFYFNMLWRFFPTFPNLQRPEVFHNMQEMFLPYLFSAVLLGVFSALLWLPRASYSSTAGKI